MPGTYSERDIDRIASSVNEVVEGAAFGRASWRQAAENFAHAFPGSFVAIQNYDAANGHLNFAEAINLAPEFLAAYYDHFVHLNPWMDLWNRSPNGAVIVVENDCPARLFRGTEFYDDWLSPQGDVEGGTGLKVDGGPNDLIHIPVHYPLSLSDIYDRATAAVHMRIRGSIERAVRISRHIGNASNEPAASSAATGRFREAALVVDGSMLIREANPAAERELVRGRFLRSIGGHLLMTEAKSDIQLRRLVDALVRGRAIDGNGFDVVIGESIWRLSLARLPRMEDSWLIVPPPPQCLVLAMNLS